MDRPVDRQTDRQTHRQTNIHTDHYTNRPTDRQTALQTDQHTHQPTDRQTYRQSGAQTGNWANEGVLTTQLSAGSAGGAVHGRLGQPLPQGLHMLHAITIAIGVCCLCVVTIRQLTPHLRSLQCTTATSRVQAGIWVLEEIYTAPVQLKCPGDCHDTCVFPSGHCTLQQERSC